MRERKTSAGAVSKRSPRLVYLKEEVLIIDVEVHSQYHF